MGDNIMENEPPTLKLDYKLFLNKSTVLYGASGTGKSAIIIDILKHLNGHAGQILVFSPTDPSNKTYSDGVVPSPLIHYDLDIPRLEQIWARQEMMSTVYARANNFAVLESLYQKLPPSGVDMYLNRVRKSRHEHIREVEDTYFEPHTRKAKTAKIEADFAEITTLIYKKYIRDNKRRLGVMKLTDDERHTLKYLDFNPNLVLIFDDCAAEIKKIEKHEVVRKLFYQNRHQHITLLIACQDDKDIESSLRKNSFVSIFTTDVCANAYFSRKANDFPRQMIKRVDALCSTFKWDKPYFEKLAYVRQENKVYKLVAQIHDDFAFGSPALREYCKSIERNGASVDKNNPFYSDFA